MKVQNVKELPSTPVGGWAIGAGMVPSRSPPSLRHRVGREWITLRCPLINVGPSDTPEADGSNVVMTPQMYWVWCAL
jgi:hypothetical protein